MLCATCSVGLFIVGCLKIYLFFSNFPQLARWQIKHAVMHLKRNRKDAPMDIQIEERERTKRPVHIIKDTALLAFLCFQELSSLSPCSLLHYGALKMLLKSPCVCVCGWDTFSAPKCSIIEFSTGKKINDIMCVLIEAHGEREATDLSLLIFVRFRAEF
jgi:hypothetical protein